jgi:NDP-sugar pyrophosphorylase family protein
MIPVAGVPLIEHVLGHFVAAGVTALVIVLNDHGAGDVEWIRARFPHLALDFVVKTTRSSLESFREILAHSTAERILISTVDAWCPDAEFTRFVQAAARLEPEATVLAVTPLVADERPLWVRLDARGRVVQLGGASGDLVTAGIYLVSRRIAGLGAPDDLDRLRDFLTWLVERGEPLYGVVIPTVVDVDRPEDIVLAESVARRASGQRGDR